MFLLVDLSQRDIRVWWDGGVEVLPFIDLERNLPTKLYKIFEKFPDVKDVFVVNGPGSFTTLRIGCLCLNIIQLRRKKTLCFYPATKKDIFSYAYNKAFLPQQGLMWIGQAKNAWELNLEEGTWEKVNIESRIDDSQSDIPYFFDESILGAREDSIAITVEKGIQLQYHDQSLDLQVFFLEKTPTEFVSPEYLVEI